MLVLGIAHWVAMSHMGQGNDACLQYMLVLVCSKSASEWFRTRIQLYADVNQSLANKLNFFTSACSLNGMTLVIVVYQENHDTLIKTSKTLNKPTSLQLSIYINSSSRCEDAIDKALKHFWANFSKGKKKENLGLNYCRFLIHKFEKLLNSLKQKSNYLEGKKAF